MQVRNLSVNRFCFRLLVVQGANKTNRTILKALTNQDISNNQAIENEWLMKPISTQYQSIKIDCLVKSKVIANE